MLHNLYCTLNTINQIKKEEVGETFYLFMVYLTTLSVAQIIWHRMIGLLMNWKGCGCGGNGRGLI
jgi:hypothetical protein